MKMISIPQLVATLMRIKETENNVKKKKPVHFECIYLIEILNWGFLLRASVSIF